MYICFVVIPIYGYKIIYVFALANIHMHIHNDVIKFCPSDDYRVDLGSCFDLSSISICICIFVLQYNDSTIFIG